MSQENVAVVGRALQAWIDTGLFTNEVSPDFVWDLSTFRGWPDQPAFRGPQGLTEFMTQWRAPYDAWTMAIAYLRDGGGDEVLAALEQWGRLRGSDSEVTLHYGAIFTVANGQVQGGRVYMTLNEALEAGGLRD